MNNNDERNFNGNENRQDERSVRRSADRLDPLTELAKSQIHTWLSLHSYNDFLSAMEKKVVGQPELPLICMNIYNYLHCIDEGRPVNCNMLLAGPSGSGKTETYRALKQYFKKIWAMPVCITDTSQITASGYRGPEPTDILKPFFEKKMKKAIGICFLDEFDKILMPSYSGSGMDTHQEVQSNFLTIIEGGQFYDKQNQCVDTSNIMFVGLGSFDQYRKKREDQPKTIGFGAQADVDETDHFAPIDRESMLETGGTNELIGRFNCVFNYGKLDNEAVYRIIDKTVENLEKEFDCSIQLGDSSVKELFEQGNSKFGCRNFDFYIRERVLKAMTSAYMQNMEGGQLEIVIDGDKTEVTANYRPEEEAVKEAM